LRQVVDEACKKLENFWWQIPANSFDVMRQDFVTSLPK